MPERFVWWKAPLHRAVNRFGLRMWFWGVTFGDYGVGVIRKQPGFEAGGYVAERGHARGGIEIDGAGWTHGRCYSCCWAGPWRRTSQEAHDDLLAHGRGAPGF